MQHKGSPLKHLDVEQLRIACVHSGSDVAMEHYNELSESYTFVRPKESDVILALGGDGLMLHALHSHMGLNKPIYGMNCGTIGFLMNEYSKDQLPQRILSAESFVLHPIAMRATTTEGEVEEALAFNEVALLRGSGQSANIRISVDGVERLPKYIGDGLIVSTPTGSTAYALSGGGPILDPALEALVLVPICPHTLSNRPIVVSDQVEIEIVVHGDDSCKAQITCDGRVNTELQIGDRVRIKRKIHDLRLIHPRQHDHFDIMRRKLRWAEQP